MSYLNKLVYVKPDAPEFFKYLKGRFGMVIRTKGWDTLYVDFGGGVRHAIKSHFVAELEIGDTVIYCGEKREVIKVDTDGTVLISCPKLYPKLYPNWVGMREIKYI